MRKAVALALVMAFAGAAAAQAGVLVRVDKTTQRMTVSVDGVPRHQWNVSTGRANFSTPNGIYAPQRLERRWFSRKYYNSPMPYSIFFHRGYAIHGSYDIARLGGPASHGCIRLHPQHAATLFALVRSAGAGATSIVVSGETMTARRASSRQRTAAGPRGRMTPVAATTPRMARDHAVRSRASAARRAQAPAAGSGWAGWGRSTD
ncbi:L,D-transpeptidase [Pseudorhodoplanes sp.]|uniref:L,D-transpeptidase n=1 Tax=Pseudorhodoplanes sp. TaxID=1934341 RepID=UPI002C2602F4|nr:L,D-transpeptidase [Pseudorhodoplanes sp.]HWV51751.1 L,D-transpeptidase [Pseudorhodoplanes sp.]